MIGRRGFITGMVSFVAAPAIVRAGSLMPVKVMVEPILAGNITRYHGFDIIWGTIEHPQRFDFSPGALNFVRGDLVRMGERIYRCTDVFE